MSISSSDGLAAGKIYVAGHRGMVGSALVRRLRRAGHTNLVVRSHEELDLTHQESAARFFAEERPDFVFLAAARVGGILANNTRPAEFIYENLAIQTNVIAQAHAAGVKRLLFLGSSCIYPRDCRQPIREEYILTGSLESTNRPYALAKLAGIEMCWAFNRQYRTQYLAVMPTNLYGTNDNYDLNSSHVLPALLRKMHEAKEAGASCVQIWGSGAPRREFLHCDDMADACYYLMNLPEEAFQELCYSESEAPLLNVGCGEDLTIRELAEIIREVVKYTGELEFDGSKPDGTPRKLLDVSRMGRLGWRASIPLRQGIERTCEEFVKTRERELEASADRGTLSVAGQESR